MEFIGNYIKNLFIHSFIAGVVIAIAGAIHPGLGGLAIFFSIFGVFITAYKATFKDMTESDKKRGYLNSKSNQTKTDISAFTIKVTSSYDKDDHYGYDDEVYELIEPSEKINIAGFEIENCLLYVNNKGTKSGMSHLIPQKLKVNQSGARNEIGYWPSYSDITPGHRYDYLKWLSEGKEDPDIDTGLLFLYFYGLEWRIVKEKKDYEWIANEVLRLMSIYDNRSFQNYSRSLLTYITFQGIKKLSEPTLLKIKELAQSARPYSTMGESGLLMFIEGTKEVTPEVLFSQIPNFENVSRSNVPGKVGHLFFEHLNFLLKDKLKEICSGAEITEHTFHIYTSSSSLGSRNLKGRAVKIPKRSQTILTKKWNQTIEDLRKYSTRINKDSKEKLYTLLPENLKQELDHPLQEQLSTLFNQESDKVLKFGKVAEICGYPFKEKYTLKECCTISDILSDTQVTLEPEPNYFRKSLKYDDLVCVYKEQNTKIDGPTYSTISMLMDLGVSLAYADGHYDESEIKTVEQFINDRFCLSSPELSLRASKRLMLYKDSAPKTTGLVKKLAERLKVKELNLIGNFLFEVAIADGNFDNSEQKYLKKVFKGLGIEEVFEASLGKYSQYIGNTSLKPSSAKNVVNEKIPQPQQAPTLSIDKDRLKELESETKQVQSALAEIFIEDESTPVAEEIAPPTPMSAGSLSKEENSFLVEVLKHATIERETMRNLAKQFGFMPGPVIEKINEWCEAQYGDYLIFDEGDYVIEQELMQNEAQSA